MSQDKSPEQLATLTFWLTMVGVGAWIAIAFIFIIL
jgi:hypothetical protein